MWQNVAGVILRQSNDMSRIFGVELCNMPQVEVNSILLWCGKVQLATQPQTTHCSPIASYQAPRELVAPRGTSQRVAPRTWSIVLDREPR